MPDAAPPFASWQERKATVEAAFDFRGDVTLTLADGTELAGYLFDRRTDDEATAAVSVLPARAETPVTVPLSQVTALRFTGADAAAGKSWEAWLAKVKAAEAEGKIAELYPEGGVT